MAGMVLNILHIAFGPCGVRAGVEKADSRADAVPTELHSLDISILVLLIKI